MTSKLITSSMIAMLLVVGSATVFAADGDIIWFTAGEATEPSQSSVLLSDTGHHQYEETGAADACLIDEHLMPTMAAVDGKKPVIAIVIDDMGMDRTHSARALNLPAEVTMAYLPYSLHVEKQTADAVAKGHKLMVHMPMEPERKTANPGPDYLGAGMSAEEIKTRVIKDLSAFKDYVGVNNHMGSKFTQNRTALLTVMKEVKSRDVFFLDSKTSPKSIAEDMAREENIPTTHRDVFIDDDESAAAVEKQIAKIEHVARRTGSAVAIGHPKEVTLNALEKWLPTLKAKGFELVDMKEMIEIRKNAKAVSASRVASSKDRPVDTKVK